MYKQTLRAGVLTLGLLVCGAPFTFAGQAPDNTKVNTRDRSKTEPTADQQKNGTSDVELTRKIRRAIMADKSLSSYAHNVKIITQHGAVTLKGPVRSDEEKSNVEAKAKEIAGGGNVTSEISVKTTKKSS